MYSEGAGDDGEREEEGEKWKGRGEEEGEEGTRKEAGGETRRRDETYRSWEIPFTLP